MVNDSDRGRKATKTRDIRPEGDSRGIVHIGRRRLLQGAITSGLLSHIAASTASAQTPVEFVDAISADDFQSVVTSVSYTGENEQYTVFDTSQPLQKFPIEGESYGVISTGHAEAVPGSATDFESSRTDGPSESIFIGGQNRDSRDVATFEIEFEVPEDANNLNFDYQYGTEENPQYLDSDFQDFFTVRLVGQDGFEENFAILPDGSLTNVDNAAEFSNAITGGSGPEHGGDPEPPFKDPNDTVFNAMTELLSVQTQSDLQAAGLAGETATLEIRFADFGDAILDSGILIDNLTFGKPTGTVPDTTDLRTLMITANGPLRYTLTVDGTLETDTLGGDYSSEADNEPVANDDGTLTASDETGPLPEDADATTYLGDRFLITGTVETLDLDPNENADVRLYLDEEPVDRAEVLS